MIGTFLRWFLGPYVLLGALVVIFRWPWQVLGIVVGVPLLIFIGTMLVAGPTMTDEERRAKVREARRQREAAIDALRPPDEPLH